MRTDLLVVDRLHRCGLKRGLLHAIDEGARLARKSYASVIWTLCSESLRRHSSGVSAQLPDASDTFLSTDARMEAVTRSFTHPWICQAESLPPGKRLQIVGLVDLVHRRSPCSLLEPAPDFHPLISQPLMETCLRIPTDLLLYRGRTRGLAREAFRDRLPPQIAERDSKGTITSYYLRMIRDNSREIWKLLRDGLLAGERLLDQQKLERCLKHGQPLRPAQLYPLLACVTAEIWLRQDARCGR
jgi:asparagine synthase (glutamine-hydrolysing)